MKKQQIIELWKEFMKDWGPKNPGRNWDPAREEMVVNKKQIMKPSFYDFMEWLVKSNK